jgi:serine/threonine protein kinase
MHYSVVGSPDYMAVEVLRGDGYNSCVDFWAIGCMMYEMIFGFPPFFGESPEEVFMNIVNYEQCLAFPEPGQGPDISPEGEAIIRALLTEPATRLGAKGGIKVRVLFWCSCPCALCSVLLQRPLCCSSLLLCTHLSRQEIKTHPFFRDFPWDNILQEEPPFVPDLTGVEDYSRFHVIDPAETAAAAAAAAAEAAVEAEAEAVTAAAEASGAVIVVMQRR